METSPGDVPTFGNGYAAGGEWHESFWPHERFMELLVQRLVELDDNKRREMYREMQAISIKQTDGSKEHANDCRMSRPEIGFPIIPYCPTWPDIFHTPASSMPKTNHRHENFATEIKRRLNIAIYAPGDGKSLDAYPGWTTLPNTACKTHYATRSCSRNGMSLG
ncbi:MAG: hypothetical protein ACR2RB_02575 [Gammaproteobacteria bacterium]